VREVIFFAGQKKITHFKRYIGIFYVPIHVLGPFQGFFEGNNIFNMTMNMNKNANTSTNEHEHERENGQEHEHEKENEHIHEHMYNFM
jgi:hypothetical protein